MATYGQFGQRSRFHNENLPHTEWKHSKCLQDVKLHNEYAKWIASLVQDHFWQSWLVNFMFEELHASELETRALMQRAVEGFYRRLITRFHRKPRSAAAFRVLPRLIGCPDYPVPKHRREGFLINRPNGGLHFNAVLFHPLAAYTLASRLRVPLDQHVKENRLTYCGPDSTIDRIDWEPMFYNPQRATKYMLKALDNGRIRSIDILILPRALSEL